jgi:hypothetical protein
MERAGKSKSSRHVGAENVAEVVVYRPVTTSQTAFAYGAL